MKRTNLETCISYAINKNGFCLATEYKNNYTKMPWQCECGYKFETTWHCVKDRHQWCPKCAGVISPTIKELQDFAKNEKDAELLSTKYKNNKTNLLWRCTDKHTFLMRWDSVIAQKQWCPYCAGKAKPTIKDIQDYINKEHYGSSLLSTEYINNYSKLLWQCLNEHIFESSWNHVKDQGHWCPECSRFKTEKLCKQILEKKLGFEFKKTRFYYDLNNNKRFLEFDGYNEENKIAFEYHGIQHYEKIDYCHKGKQTLEYQQEKDDYKEQYAAENNITLIIIPYTEKDNLEEYITKIIGELNDR